MTGQVWPEMIRLLWLGKGVTGNLVEPAIQLAELTKAAECGRELWAQADEGAKALAAEEWRRQIEELERFRLLIEAAKEALAPLAGKEAAE